MPFNASVPLATDSPSNFPAQNQTNMSRLQTIISANHVFNLSPAANDGYHNVVNLTQQAPSGPLAATGRLYAKTAGSFVQLFYMDDAGRDYQITPGLICAVNFQGSGTNGAQTLRSVVNVSSVNRTAQGRYTINFTAPIANINYVVSVTGMRIDAGECFGFVQSDGTYNDNVKVGSINVGFQSSGGNYRDVLMGNVLIYSAS